MSWSSARRAPSAYGSAVSKFRPGPADLPTFATLGLIDIHTHNAIAPSFLGPAHGPFIFDPVAAKDDITKMLTPQIEVASLKRDADLLRAVDGVDRIRRVRFTSPHPHDFTDDDGSRRYGRGLSRA